jgi:hypothetical protein
MKRRTTLKATPRVATVPGKTLDMTQVLLASRLPKRR